ncbi:MAG: amidase [Microthrixaceae bacterium]|nr:amidase [Microthrixaceae bacterium]
MTRFTSALDCAAAIRSKEVSPVEVLDEYLAEVDRLNPTLNAFSLRDDERARADAQAAADLIASSAPEDLPPFIGVPLPIKDLNHVKGWVTSFGSGAVPDTPAARDDLVVERFRRAGFVLMGKTTTPEFGSVSVTESERFGITRNPWNPDFTPGGSSGGAAAAVASGMAPIAHASDGGGSIRIPASCTGLVGLKASRNRITEWTEKLHGGSTSGVLTRTIADTAAALDVLAPTDPNAWNNALAPQQTWSSEVGADPGRLRIRVARLGALGGEPPTSLDAALRRTADALSDLGHDVVEGEPEWPDLLEFFGGFVTIWGTINAGVEGLDPSKLEPHNRESYTAAEAKSSIEYAKAITGLQYLSRRFMEQFGRDFDLLVSPTMAIEPPAAGWLFEGVHENPSEAVMRATPMAAFTAIFNVTGQPALSLPLHVSEAGLPIGVQFAAPACREDMLIRVGSQLEAVMPWADRWPALAAG